MPFQMYIPPRPMQVLYPATTRLPQTVHEVPYFLIPGIYLTGSEFKSLALELYIESKGKPIYIYSGEENQIFGETPGRENRFKQLASSMISEISDILPYDHAPYLLVGFSYGCPLAWEMAQLLQHDKQETALFMIDSPTADLSKQYLLEMNELAFRDIQNILNALVVAFKLPAIDVRFDELTEVLTQPPIDRLMAIISALAAKIVNVHEPSNPIEQMLVGFIQRMGSALFNLITYESPEQKARLLQHVAVLMTTETTQKYKSADGGWREYAGDELTVIGNETLKQAGHLALVEKRELAALLAVEIVAHFNKVPSLRSDENLLMYYCDKFAGKVLRRMESLSNVESVRSLRKLTTDMMTVCATRNAPVTTPAMAEAAASSASVNMPSTLFASSVAGSNDVVQPASKATPK